MKIIRGKTPSPRRVMLYGVHGVGKSTWAAQCPDVLFLNLEDGLNDIDCARTDHLKSFDSVLSVLRELAADANGFSAIAVDTVDWMEQLIHKTVAKAASKESIADIGYGAGYKQALAYWDRFLFALDWLRTECGFSVILLAHAEIKRFDSPEQDSYDRYQPALHDKASALLQEWCDEVLFASYRVFVRKEDQGFNKERSIAVGDGDRYVRTQETAAVNAKNRLGLPVEIGFSWHDYARHWVTGSSGNISGKVVNGSSKTESE